MFFPAVDRLHLLCRFERLVPGQLHPDGRRYLPLLLLRPLVAPSEHAPSPPVTLLGVVDRHHRIDPALAGREGVARLVFLLSTISEQVPPYRRGLQHEAERANGRASTAPLACGQVIEVLSWQMQQAQLAHTTVDVELLLDIGIGVVGVRTSLSAPEAATATASIAAGTWLHLTRSRIDILGFTIRQSS